MQCAKGRLGPKKKPQRWRAEALDNVILFPAKENNHMANATAAAIHTQEAESHRFISANGKYGVSMETKQSELLDDIGCWTEQAEGIVQTMIFGCEGDVPAISASPRHTAKTLYAILTLLEMIAGAAEAANVMEHRAA